MRRIWPGVAAAILLMLPTFAAAQGGSGCEPGRQVTDEAGHTWQAVAGQNGFCLVKSADGRTQRWLAVPQLGAATAAPPADAVAVLRPKNINRLQYRADPLGHFVVAAQVNDAPVRFLIDTGATVVALTPEDAGAAGLKRSELVFTRAIQTANGPAHAATVRLRRVRIDDLEMEDVEGVVIDTLKQSILGMSFLRRLKGFAVRDGVLTMDW